MKRLVRLYPAAWRERYGEEMEALLEERPLGPFDVLDLFLGALDAHLHLRGLGHASEHEKGFTMSLRIAGYSAVVAGSLWVILGVILAVGSASASDETPIVGLAIGFAAGLALLAALAGLSGYQARHDRRLVWLSFALPAFGSLLFLGAIPLFLIEPNDGVSSTLGWTLLMVSWFTIPIGSFLFGSVTLRRGVFSRNSGVALMAGSATMLLVFIATIASDWNSTLAMLSTLVGVAGFGAGWLPIGIEAIRGDQQRIVGGTTTA